MHVQFEYITTLQYEVKQLEKLVESFWSGEKYIRMKEEFRKITDGLKREIRRLNADLAAAHAETLRVRSFWIQACEDLEKEKGKNDSFKERYIFFQREILIERITYIYQYGATQRPLDDVLALVG